MDSGGGLLSVLFWSQQAGAALHGGKRVCAGQPQTTGENSVGFGTVHRGQGPRAIGVALLLHPKPEAASKEKPPSEVVTQIPVTA